MPLINCYRRKFRNTIMQQSQQITDPQLERMSREITEAVSAAKALAESCKVGFTDQTQYVTLPGNDLSMPPYQHHINYNEEFWKKYLKNEINFAIIKELTQKLTKLDEQIIQIDQLHQQYQQLNKIKNRKKLRRQAAQIPKNFECPYQSCYRVYGSDVSLNLHIKLKHGGGNKTDRQKLAEQICHAQAHGLPLPEMRFNLPLGFLQSFRKNFEAKEIVEPTPKRPFDL